VASAGIAEAKTPGKTYCFNGICHRVKTISETQRLVGVRTVLHASHYDSCKKDRFNPCGLTSSGEEFRPWKSDNAASPLYPDGTKLLVWHPGSKKAAVVRINNAGPYYGKRTLDLSRATADKLGFGKGGVSTVHAKVIAAPTPSEATYKRNRTYASVPGYIGFFDTIDKALTSLGQAVAGLFGAPAQAASRPPAIARTRIATTTKANGAKSNGDKKPSGAAKRTTSADGKKPKSAAAKSLAHG
jgi:rare lipoprotein A